MTTTVDFVINDAMENLIKQGAIVSDDEGVFFQRQLELVSAQSFDNEYPDLAGRGLLSTNTEGGEGVEILTYRSFDKRGEAEIIAGKATNLPRGDIDGEEYSINVRTIGNAFGYSRQELAAAKMTGMPLEARKAEATHRAYEEKCNQVIFFGSAPHKLHGIFGGPAGAPWSTVATSSEAAGAGGKNTWADKTGDEDVKDLTDACAQMYADTKKLYKPDGIIMPVAKKMFLANTPISDQFPMTSCLSWFLANNTFITSADQIKDVNEVAGIYPDVDGGETIQDFKPDGSGVEGFTLMCSGPDKARIREPFPYMHLPVQLKGLEFEINCYGRFAGVEMIRPAAFSHHTGI